MPDVTNAAVHKALGRDPWDETKCRVCGWPLAERIERGCVKGNCSMRPYPDKRADAIADYLHDQDLALRVLVPALRAKGYEVIAHWCAGGVIVRAITPGIGVACEAMRETFAAALCLVVVAAMGEG